MKHHGNYWLPTVEELLKCAELGEVGFVARSIGRIKKKHHNDKRHKEKRKRFMKPP